jgi:hypothetical protein
MEKMELEFIHVKHIPTSIAITNIGNKCDGEIKAIIEVLVKAKELQIP